MIRDLDTTIEGIMVGDPSTQERIIGEILLPDLEVITILDSEGMYIKIDTQEIHKIF